jgi:hypothetical protein
MLSACFESMKAESPPLNTDLFSQDTRHLGFRRIRHHAHPNRLRETRRPYDLEFVCVANRDQVWWGF